MVETRTVEATKAVAAPVTTPVTAPPIQAATSSNVSVDTGEGVAVVKSSPPRSRVVLRPIPGPNGSIAPGTTVRTESWRNEMNLVKTGRLSDYTV